MREIDIKMMMKLCHVFTLLESDKGITYDEFQSRLLTATAGAEGKKIDDIVEEYSNQLELLRFTSEIERKEDIKKKQAVIFIELLVRISKTLTL